MASGVETGQITTDIPARLDRLPWSRWHWMIVIGLGTVWILDGLEVTIVGSMSDALKPASTGLGMSSSDIGLAGSMYVAGACVGALVFGQLTDRFGRKRLFLITLAFYIFATVLTAFSMNPTWYFAARALTGAAIGGEYAAINSAIDELIPAKYRGRIDVAINGSFWVGAAAGALLTIPLLDPTVVSASLGWRLAFGLGAILAVGVLLVRRHVPESPRWLFIHGREDEGEEIVRDIEREVQEETGQRPAVGEGHDHDPAAQDDRDPADRQDGVHDVPEADRALLLAVRRPGVPLQRVLLHLRRHPHHVPRRRPDRLLHRRLRGQQLRRGAAPGPAVRHRRSGQDDHRHLRLVRACCSAIAGFMLGDLTATTLTLFGAVIFFFASAGASAAYLTASEVFPMETRALCIAFFYAIGTAVGGITGPLLFGKLIDNASASGDITGIAPGYFLGAGLMIAGGIVAAFLGVKAEGQSLEDIAQPLTAEDAETGGQPPSHANA